MELISKSQCFGGEQFVHKHVSEACNCDMTFAIYLPPQAKTRPRADALVSLRFDLYA